MFPLFFSVLLLNDMGSGNLLLRHYSNDFYVFFSLFLPDDVGSDNLWMDYVYRLHILSLPLWM